jgi:putative ABC transport system permease protein
MIRNYILIALRHLSRQRVYVLINILGLALGMALSLLIVLFIRHEKSYDQYHPNADRIYRIAENAVFDKKNLGTLLLPYELAPWLNKNVPSVECAIHLLKGSHKLVYTDTVSLPASGFYYSDPQFFSVFSYPLILGNPDSALVKPFTIVLTQSIAKQYFGDANPLGQVLKLDNGWKFKVTGICKDVPSNSHFHFDYMASILGIEDALGIKSDWMNHISLVYVLLRKNADVNELNNDLRKLVADRIIPAKADMLGLTPEKFQEMGNIVEYKLQPLTSIHLNSAFDGELEANSSSLYIYIFSILSLLILIVACINFMNLGTARSSIRAKEIALRKILGAARPELVVQFLAEAVVMSFLSLFLALVLMELLLQPFNFITGRSLEAFTPENLTFIPWLLLGTLLLGIFSGLWPAFFMSKFGILPVLRGISGGLPGGFRFRKNLVLIQFTVTILFIICTLLVYEQVHFYQDKNLGFDKSHILVVQRAYALNEKKDKFRDFILRNPAITGVSYATEIPGEVMDNYIMPVRKDSSVNSTLFYIRITGVDQEYARTMGLQMLDGSFFSEDTSLHYFPVVLNQSAITQLKLENPLGKDLFIPAREGKKPETMKICGIIMDFHNESLRQEIQPLMLYKSNPGDHLQYMLVRYEAGMDLKVQEGLQTAWNQFLPGQPFETFFIRNKLDAQYAEERMTARLMGLFSLISILIAVLGLLGLASFMADRKVREIGIRKAMGASVGVVLKRLSAEYLNCILWANLIAFPLAYLTIYLWLNKFPYHITVNPWVFLLAASGAFVTGIITVFYHTMKSANTNPALALHHE